ncbi:VWA domain-containing protein [Streptomyces sp. MS1.AVA.1]|uniref:VWA domain-containing protein n=1 Tax=Streptomyces machairae TaxID=3134109 RepID=A0ABU8UPY4_9ACTN
MGLSFALEVDAPSDLAHDEQRADALVTVTARSAADGEANALPDRPGAEILIMDRSLSMSGRKLDEAKRALCAAIDTLRDGTHLGIVAGHHKAEVIFPATGGLARVDALTREDAKLRVIGQFAEGGTAIGQWLTCAQHLFTSVAAPGTVRHAVLYTDGKDEHETPEQLGTYSPPAPTSSCATPGAWAATGTTPSCCASPRPCTAPPRPSSASRISPRTSPGSYARRNASSCPVSTWACASTTGSSSPSYARPALSRPT